MQAHLGHATASITLDTRGHLFPDELGALAGGPGLSAAACTSASVQDGGDADSRGGGSGHGADQVAGLQRGGLL